MAEHFIHGFNVWDGGEGTLGNIAPYFDDPVLHDYGWTFLFRLRFTNDRTVERLLKHIEPGDVLVAHSNGCLIAWQLVMAGAPVSAVICIQPALRKDTLWPENLPVLCCHNKKDWIVNLGRVWGRLMSVTQPWRERHGWGAAGRHGFTSRQPRVVNWDTDVGVYPAQYHSGFFRIPARAYWGPLVGDWRRLHLPQRVDARLTPEYGAG